MSEGLNLVTLLGNLGADPELKTSARGPVLRMRLATEQVVFDKEKQEKDKRTEWHYLTMFGPRTEALARMLHKGDRIAVTGHLHTSSWEKEGQKHYRTEVIVEELRFAGSPRMNGVATTAFADRALAPNDLPF